MKSPNSLISSNTLKLLMTLLFLAHSGCSHNLSISKAIDDPALSDSEVLSEYGQQEYDKENQTVYLELNERMTFPSSSSITSSEEEDDEPLYSFKTSNIPLTMALKLFAATYDLNIIPDEDISGSVDVAFTDLPFKSAMETLLDVFGYYWEWEENIIRVKKMETRTFVVDYIRLERGGSGNSQAKVSSGSSGGGQAGEVKLSQKDTIDFWKELESQLKIMLSANGKMVINRLSGIVQVEDLHTHVVKIQDFLNATSESMHRQVVIEAKILEVTLSSDNNLGINWHKIDLGTSAAMATSSMITNPIGGLQPKITTMSFAYRNDDIDYLVNALKEQGKIKVVSQPRILTLNNQPAMIKVGTDQSFFTQTVTVNEGVSTVTDDLQTVTVGVVLSITPQISADGWIMLDVTPIITRLVGTVTSPRGSTAPVLDVKQSSSLVRLRDGELVVIGGLIQEQKSKTERKVPILGDLPIIGTLFQGSYDSTNTRELVVLLSPRIVN
jgi:MSHA biogenesis protein MshL